MIDPGLTAVPVDIPVEWAMNGCDAPAMRGGVDRFYRWHDGAWMRRVTHAFPVGGERPVEYVVTVDRTRHVFRGRVLAFHPDGLALVMEEPVRTLVVIPVDALRVREKERE